MKRSINLIITSLVIALLTTMLLPALPVSADIYSKIIKVGSLQTQTGGTSGALSLMGRKDQSGTVDNPAKYVLFSTPGVAYRGTRIYTLPTYINDSSVQTLQLRVNVKVPGYGTQRWIWRVYDWDAGTWVRFGDNALASENTWSLLVFDIPSSPARFINASRQVKIQFFSSNANGDAKIDSEFFVASFDYQMSGCGETTNDTFENNVLNLLNQERAKARLSSLTRDSRLDTAARLHSSDMACNDFFAHTNLLGTPFNVRITNQGYSYWFAGENIAAGYPTDLLWKM